MTLARIYPFFRKDRKMKLDRVKEEIANIRQWQNITIVILVGIFSYLFTAKGIGIVKAFGIMFFLSFLFVFLIELNSKMKNKLKELEQATKDD